jgi:hypothetical protein
MTRGRNISVDALLRKDKRQNIPTAELEPVMDEQGADSARLGAAQRRPRPRSSSGAARMSRIGPT